ncbi:unnamed protein product [Trichogramma brassicae]|uniref:Uncharacterized protein n=1 Tax=Trichogramma brassicae TaxID=86971 RepID=A0A6H5J324_9HYME|nr:unnamed protein product [Trichogramma brassicae]
MKSNHHSLAESLHRKGIIDSPGRSQFTDEPACASSADARIYRTRPSTSLPAYHRWHYSRTSEPGFSIAATMMRAEATSARRCSEDGRSTSATTTTPAHGARSAPMKLKTWSTCFSTARVSSAKDKCCRHNSATELNRRTSSGSSKERPPREKPPCTITPTLLARPYNTYLNKSYLQMSMSSIALIRAKLQRPSPQTSSAAEAFTDILLTKLRFSRGCLYPSHRPTPRRIRSRRSLQSSIELLSSSPTSRASPSIPGVAKEVAPGVAGPGRRETDTSANNARTRYCWYHATTHGNDADNCKQGWTYLLTKYPSSHSETRAAE